MKNATKAQRFSVDKQTQEEIKMEKEDGRLEAVSLFNTRGSSNSSYTQEFYKLFVCMYTGRTIERIELWEYCLKTPFTAAGQRDIPHGCACTCVFLHVNLCECQYLSCTVVQKSFQANLHTRS